RRRAASCSSRSRRTASSRRSHSCGRGIRPVLDSTLDAEFILEPPEDARRSGIRVAIGESAVRGAEAEPERDAAAAGGYAAAPVQVERPHGLEELASRLPDHGLHAGRRDLVRDEERQFSLDVGARWERLVRDWSTVVEHWP